MFNSIANYGHRLRIGVILPSVNLVVEPQISALLPPGVSLHTTRFCMPANAADLPRMVNSLEEAARLLADANVELIVFHCTAVSMMQGLKQNIEELIQQVSGCRTFTTGQAVVAALRAVGAAKIVMLCPNPQGTYDEEAGFLRGHGIQVLGGACMGILGGKRLFSIDPQDFYRLAIKHRTSEANAYLISCTAVRSVEVIEALERDLQRPVLTSNQAMLWHALRVGGVPDAIPHIGKLFTTAAVPDAVKAAGGPGN